MKKIICIGELSLDIVMSSVGQPQGAMPGGRIANAAMILGHRGMQAVMASDAAQDPVGDLVVDELSHAGVDTANIDRYTEGRTPVHLYFAETDDSALPLSVRYEQYPEECFDIVWPRISDGDIILYGGYYVIDPRMSENVRQFLTMASERGCLLVYVPGFLAQKHRIITRVMPAILENLELANIVISRLADLELIFGQGKTPEEFYEKHLQYYCQHAAIEDCKGGTLSGFTSKSRIDKSIPTPESRTVLWNAGLLAGIIQGIYDTTAKAMMSDQEALWEHALEKGIASAQVECDAIKEDWKKTH